MNVDNENPSCKPSFEESDGPELEDARAIYRAFLLHYGEEDGRTSWTTTPWPAAAGAHQAVVDAILAKGDYELLDRWQQELLSGRKALRSQRDRLVSNAAWLEKRRFWVEVDWPENPGWAREFQPECRAINATCQRHGWRLDGKTIWHDSTLEHVVEILEGVVLEITVRDHGEKS